MDPFASTLAVTLSYPSLFVILVFVYTIWRFWFDHVALLPPGPWGFPVLGVLHKLGKFPYLTVQEWWNQYGDVFSMYMGSRFCIVINGMELMEQCFVKQADNFNDRPWNLFKKLARNRGLVFTDGAVWREQRRFSLRCLRDLGMGKISLEHRITEELQFLIEQFQKFGSKSFDPSLLIQKAVSNNICSMLYGSRFEYDDPDFDRNVRKLDQSVRYQSLLTMMQFIPIVEHITKLLPVGKMLFENVKLRDEYATKQIRQHIQTLDPDHPRDFIDAYLLNIKQQSESGTVSSLDEYQLHRVIQDLFIAGTETVNATLRWSILFLAIHQDVQAAAFKEISEVIGQGRSPSIKDKHLMPITTAIIMECQRLGNIALFSVPRCATKDTSLNGFYVPKGTWVFVNRWGAHMSTRYWNNPSKFDYTRFLNLTHTAVVAPRGFIPFGIGPRNCLGESLAKMELFLTVTNLLQKFKISLPNKEQRPSLQPRMGINMSPVLYKIQLEQR